ncbi:hypothetical protein ONZ51_g13231 [Trametes cubensis]|uniref:Reverse transcriptase domain-containing protein n=1 Tax=Trametes cubensis TaxID=1111947 RepID=A0AAD7X498_9APHY|nr:hypothetical protein ONZ51_g13231 [Trametes cubensis]
MANIASEHYNSIQFRDPLSGDDDHDQYIRDALRPMKQSLSNKSKATLAKKLSRQEVCDAIKTAATDKSPGLDGLPTEVWKAYVRWYESDSKRGAGGVDFVKYLTMFYNDIAQYGVVPDSTFADGWICPVYKLKKDKRDIENYRPITLLNTDYKIMTRALALRLADCAAEVIHPDQAGFMPGRSIFDHIRLATLMIDYAEAEEVNGAIVALDQEKAYDRIDHTYLWSALEHINFPRTFINTVKNLYERAVSCVIINGVKSNTFRIVRGVRQGDPMSCLLFDFAIEPLAAAFRSSSLKGFPVPGSTERLVAKLFADDTTVFLSEEDDYTIVEDITA